MKVLKLPLIAVAVLALTLLPPPARGQATPEATGLLQISEPDTVSPGSGGGTGIQATSAPEATTTAGADSGSIDPGNPSDAVPEDSSPTKADSRKDPSIFPGWEFYMAPYFWAPSMSATSTVEGSAAELNLTFADILKNFTAFGVMGRAEVWKRDVGIGDLGLTIDGYGLFMKGHFSHARTDLILSPGAKLDVDIAQVMTDYALSYRFPPLPLEKVHKKFGWRTLTFEPYGGVRYSYLRQKIKAKITLTRSRGGTRTRKAKLGDSFDWVEPFVGMRMKLGLVKRLNLVMRGDIGGFGFGSASKYTFNALSGLEYQFWRHASLYGGYRLTGMDYERGSGPTKFGLDTLMYGPQIGVMFRF